MRYWTLLILMAAMLLPMSAYGTAMAFTVNVLGSNEMAATTSAGTGSSTVVLDPVARTLQLDLSFTNLTYRRYDRLLVNPQENLAGVSGSK